MVHDCNVNSLCRLDFLAQCYLYILPNTTFLSNVVATFHMHIYSIFIFNQNLFNGDYIFRLEAGRRGLGGFELFEDPV